MFVRKISLFLTSTLLLALSGCLVESTLHEDGGGTMKVEIRGNTTDTLPKIKSRFTSPNSEITNATMDDKKNVVVELTYKDFTKLNTMPFFSDTTFTLTEDAKENTKTATATVKQAKAAKLNDEQLEYFGKELKVVITFPGEVVKTNGKIADKTVTWTVPTNILIGADPSMFSATYKSAGSAAPAATAAANGTPAAISPTAAPKKKTKK